MKYVWYVLQAAAYLDQAEYDSGNHVEDLRAQSMIRQMIHDSRLQDACALPFDEAGLWQGQGGPILRKHIQNQFRNIRFPSVFPYIFRLLCLCSMNKGGH